MGSWRMKREYFVVVKRCTGCRHSGINVFVSDRYMSIHELCKRVWVISHIGGLGFES